ncbi:MAG TPA: Pr6Pr family membrane protein [Flavitalea sp.]|nr:Pr6Pr family membrane protein [Flavitalea sp.]
MKESLQSSERKYLAFIAILGLFALPAQLYLAIQNRTAGIPETIIRFFSYFTILTNILILMGCLVLAINMNTRLTSFFSKPTTRTASAVYITIVGVIYNTLLAQQWKPTGLQLVVDQLLHTVIPLLYITYWIIFVRRYRLEWKAMLPWTIFPIVYCLYTFLRGPIAGFYPYPFLDVTKLGYTQAFINIIGIVIAFLFISAIFIAATRIIRPTSKSVMETPGDFIN